MFSYLQKKLTSLLILLFLDLIYLSQYVLDKDVWLSFRGTEMVVIMKGFSSVFDSMNQKHKFSEKLEDLSVTSFFGYMLSINTGILGPWISYGQHISSLQNSRHNQVINRIENNKVLIIK
jgi:hypothetical protein